MALKQMLMPKLGESVTEGTISKWLVQPGDHIAKYEPLAEVMTDKVNAEIPSSYTGIVKELKAEENQTLAVGEIICFIEAEGEEEQQRETEAESFEKREEQPVEQGNNIGKMRYSPAVLKLSQEHGIDLAKVPGTGKEGRVTRKDVLKWAASSPTEQKVLNEEKERPQPLAQPAVSLGSPEDHKAEWRDGDKEIKVAGVRKAIADKMSRSSQEIPHGWTMVEVDATNMVKLRNALKEDFRTKEGYGLTYFAFFVKAVAQALSEFPQINSMWAGDKIVEKKEINLSIAVATEDALYVPVIKNADEKSIKGIAKEINALAKKAKTGKLTMDDMQGGTFTINNTGSFGSVQSMGIINYPQAAILQVESIVKRPVIVDDMIAVRDMVNLCLSLDHRVLDGLVCGRFLARVKEIIEEMSEKHTSVY